MDHEDIAKRCAESIMQRANDTYPRTLHKDMLVDEIGKAIKEATKQLGWPPAVALGDLAGALFQAHLREPVSISICPTTMESPSSHASEP